MARYGMEVKVQGTYEEAKQRIVEALKEQGFGILSEIDVQRTLKEKIGADFERYEILGACAPDLAKQALEAERSIGLLLPCNVVVRQAGSEVEVSVLDPEAMFEVTEPEVQQRLAELARGAKERLGRALDSLR